MNLRLQAAADAKTILENVDDFGWPIVVTSPTGVAAELVGYSADIGLTLDPETGQPVSGRQASVALSLKALADAGLDVPRGTGDNKATPWRVRFTDTQGRPQNFKVAQSIPDRTVDVIVLKLEAYRE